MVSSVESQSVYTDLSGLNSISSLGRKNTPEAMRQVAQQFESLFLNIMLKAMRDSTAVFAEGNYLQSNEMEFHQENLDNQLSLSMSEGRGLGLANVLYEQMMGQYGMSGTSRQEPARESTGPIGQALQDLKPAPVNEVPVAAAQTIPESSIESPQEFVERLYPIAEEVASSIGVDPRVLLAQSALETGWGRKVIAMPDGSNSHNLFGIKADSRWTGNQTTVNTVEYRDGVAAQEKASFRSYDSYEESFRDYVNFLQENPRYQQALEQTHDARSFAQGLQNAGYATDPIYAKKIDRVMNSKTMQFGLSQVHGRSR